MIKQSLIENSCVLGTLVMFHASFVEVCYRNIHMVNNVSATLLYSDVLTVQKLMKVTFISKIVAKQVTGMILFDSFCSSHV